MLKIFLLLIFLPSSLLAETSPKCPGQSGYFYTNNKSKRNPRKGGFVSDSANVGDHVFIAPTAAVCGSASVLKFSRVYGNAIVKGQAEVTDKARVYGDAIISGDALIGGEAKVSRHAQITGDAILKGTASAKGYIILIKGTKTKGTYTAAKPSWAVKRDAKKNAANIVSKNIKNQAALMKETRQKLEGFQRDLKQGWYGKDERQGFYRSFKFNKGDVKPPCGFYLKLVKEERVLDSHCRRVKRVRRKKWIPGKSDFKNVTNCKKEYSNEGEKYFDLRKFSVGVHNDYKTNRDYLNLNSYYFHVGGNARKVNEYGEKLKTFARKYCGYKK